MFYSNPSSYGRPSSNLGDSKTLSKNIESFIENVKNIETTSVNSHEARLPSVVNRLIDREGKYYKHRKKLPAQNRSPPKTPQVRKVKKHIDINPGAAHYKPNFDAVLASEPKITFPKAAENPDISCVDCVPMKQMVIAFTSHIRSVSFTHINNTSDLKPLEPSCVENQKVYIMPSKDIPIDEEPEAKRDSYIVGEVTPGPSAYTLTKKPTRYMASFDGQASRRDLTEHFEKPIRDIGPGIDATLKRQPKAIPFNKQASREHKKKEEAEVWKEIEEEQKKLVESLINEGTLVSRRTTAKNEKKKKIVEPMSRGGRDERGPFAHLMRKEIEPSTPYDVDRGYKYFERPKTSFDIGQRSFKEDRQIYVKTEAPDVLYSNVDEEWKGTKHNDSVPNFDQLHDRYDAYHYMPKTCGEDDKRSKKEIRHEEMLKLERTLARTQLKRKRPRPYKRMIDTPITIKRHNTEYINQYGNVFK